MYKGIFYTHLITVNLFLLIYLVKTILLLANKEESLARFTKGVKVPEMIISTLFLVSGIYMLTQIPEIKSMMIIKIVLVFASIPLAVIGFRKKNKMLAVLSLVMIIAAYGLAEMSKKQKAKTEAPAEQTAPVAGPVNGHDIFIDNCAKCHGEDGKLGLMGSRDLTISELDLNAKIEIVRKGRGAMAGFEGVLSEEQIKAVSEYTESLNK